MMLGGGILMGVGLLVMAVILALPVLAIVGAVAFLLQSRGVAASQGTQGGRE